MANKNFRVKHGLEVAGSATIDNDLTVTGNLTVSGDTTTLNTATLSVEDNIVILNSTVTGTPVLNAGIEVERGTSTNSALTWDETADKWYQDRGGISTVIPVSTSELSESGNLYYTDVRARASNSAGTGVSYDSATGVISIGQAVGTSDAVVFSTVDANIIDDNYVLGQITATRNTAYVPPVSALTSLAGQNGFVVASSSGGNGYGAAVAVRYHSGDTTAGTNNAPAYILSGTSGTSTSPGGCATNQVLGAINIDGYTAGTSNNYASTIATTNAGGGTTAITALQAQGYARQAFTNSTTVTTAVTGASGTGSVATLNFTLQNTAPYIVGQTVTIAGMTPSGYNGSVVITAATTSSISYANATTGFTSGGTIGAANTVTAAGTGFRVRGFANSTPMYAQNRFNFMDLTASAATFKSAAYTFQNDVITGSTLTANNYMTLGTSGHTIGNVDGPVVLARSSGVNAGIRPGAFVRNSHTVTAAPTDGDGASYRLQTAGSNGTVYHLAEINSQYNTSGDTSINFSIANGTQNGSTMTGVFALSTQLSGTTIRATASPTATAGGNTLSDVANFSAGSAAITTSGRFTVTRTTAGSGLLLTLKTANANPANNDEIDFRLGVTGTSTSSNFAKVDGAYKSSGLNEIGLSVSTDSFTSDSNRIYIGTRESTKILATPSGGGSVATIMEVSNNQILNNRAHRNAITTATVTEGSTYTPAATDNNSISLTVNTGSGTTIIDLVNLTGQGTGGMYTIMVFNNAATGTPIQVKNTRINTNNLTTHTIPAGDRIMVTVYVVGDYATSEHLVVA